MPEIIGKKVSLFIDNQSIVTALSSRKATSGQYLIKTFGGMLREDLVSLVRRQNTSITRRPKTSQSDTLSMDSNDGSTKELFHNREEYYSELPSPIVNT